MLFNLPSEFRKHAFKHYIHCVLYVKLVLIPRAHHSPDYCCLLFINVFNNFFIFENAIIFFFVWSAYSPRYQQHLSVDHQYLL